MRRYLTLALASLTLSLTLAAHTPAALAQTNTQTNTQTNKDAQLAARIKSEVNSHGVGARVSIKLRNKNKLTGNIERIGDHDFTIATEDSPNTQTIAYTDTLEVKRPSARGMSKGAKIAIIAVGTLFIMSLIGNRGFGG